MTFIQNVIDDVNLKNSMINVQRVARQNALEVAGIFVSPYTDITKNLRLSNNYCTLRLTQDRQIIGIEKADAGKDYYRTFAVTSTTAFAIDDAFNMLCTSFEHNTRYNTLLELCEGLKMKVVETRIPVKHLPNDKVKKHIEQVTEAPNSKIDVNNCSEMELTALPGINIVMSKKIVNKREEIGGFKTLHDFFVFIRIKPHMQERLEKMVTISPMRGSVAIKRFNERNIDL